jgi:cytidyltransferase-like protein
MYYAVLCKTGHVGTGKCGYKRFFVESNAGIVELFAHPHWLPGIKTKGVIDIVEITKNEYEHGQLKHVAEEIRDSGRKIVCFSGTFAFLTPAHVRTIAEIRKKFNQEKYALVILANTDRRIKELGKWYSVFDEEERKDLLSSTKGVDYVCFFHEDTPLQALQALGAEVLVKGRDWEGKMPEEEVKAPRQGVCYLESKGRHASAYAEAIGERYIEVNYRRLKTAACP